MGRVMFGEINGAGCELVVTWWRGMVCVVFGYSAKWSEGVREGVCG